MYENIKKCTEIIGLDAFSSENPEKHALDAFLYENHETSMFWMQNQ